MRQSSAHSLRLARVQPLTHFAPSEVYWYSSCRLWPILRKYGFNRLLYCWYFERYWAIRGWGVKQLNLNWSYVVVGKIKTARLPTSGLDILYSILWPTLIRWVSIDCWLPNILILFISRLPLELSSKTYGKAS